MSDNKIIVYNEKNTKKSAGNTISLDDTDLISWKFSSKTKGTYKKAWTRYYNAKKWSFRRSAIIKNELFNIREVGEDVSDYIDPNELDLKRM